MFHRGEVMFVVLFAITPMFLLTFQNCTRLNPQDQAFASSINKLEESLPATRKACFPHEGLNCTLGME